MKRIGLKWMWSQLSWSQIIVVSNELISIVMEPVWPLPKYLFFLWMPLQLINRIYFSISWTPQYNSVVIPLDNGQSIISFILDFMWSTTTFSQLLVTFQDTATQTITDYSSNSQNPHHVRPSSSLQELSQEWEGPWTKDLILAHLSASC